MRWPWSRPAAPATCGKPGPHQMGACTRRAGHANFCYAGDQAAMHRALNEADRLYPDNREAARAYLRAALTPGARVG